MALDFIIIAESKLRIVSPLWTIVTIQKPPILGANGIEANAEFHSLSTQVYGRIPFFPNGNLETCTINRLSNTWPFGNCVYGWIYFIAKYKKEDPECNDESRETKKVIPGF